jgi:hypothetical protein
VVHRAQAELGKLGFKLGDVGKNRNLDIRHGIKPSARIPSEVFDFSVCLTNFSDLLPTV